MDRQLLDSIDGEIALVIDYKPGESEATLVLQCAMRLIESLDALDHSLLSSIDTNLTPVSILNDIQHSSLKILLARALKNVPDSSISSLNWKLWVGSLLIKGKYLLLDKLDGTPAEIQEALNELKPEYLAAPNDTLGFKPPSLEQVLPALNKVKIARSSFPDGDVSVQTEYGDIDLPYIDAEFTIEKIESDITFSSKGRNLFKVKYADLLGNAQWSIIKDGRAQKAEITHIAWLNQYHARKIVILSGDSLDADFEEEIIYDKNQMEISRKLVLTYIYRVVQPPETMSLFP